MELVRGYGRIPVIQNSNAAPVHLAEHQEILSTRTAAAAKRDQIVEPSHLSIAGDASASMRYVVRSGCLGFWDALNAKTRTLRRAPRFKSFQYRCVSLS